MRLVIEVETTGIGNPLTTEREDRPVELFIGSAAFTVTRLEKAED